MIESLSCGIVVYDEIKEIQNLLPKLKIELSQYDVEWVFVLNHEQPEIRKWIATWIRTQVGSCICIENPSNNLGFARQLLLENASHDYIYLTDPDIDIIPGNLKKLIQLAQNEIVNAAQSHIIGYGGTVTHKSENSFIQSTFDFMSKVSQRLPFAFQIQNHPFLVSVDHLPACHLLLNKQMALRIGGFSSALKKCGEDLDFTPRAYNANLRFIFLPAAQVLHWQNLSIGRWFLKIFNHGRIQIPVQHMNSKSGFRFYRLLPVFSLILIGLLSILNYYVLLAALVLFITGSLFSIGFMGFALTFIVYSFGEFAELIWPFFEYKSAKELKELNLNLQKQFYSANASSEE